MKKKLVTLLFASLLLALTGMAQAATVTDTIQNPTGYFVPTDSQKYDSPYYRWYNEDWGWKHNAIGGTISSATLNISAWDVDAAYGEVDDIFVFNANTSAWDKIGSLAGGDNSWSYTTFTLDSQYFDEIANGLQVWIDIDTTHNYQNWAVTLAKSVLSIDGGTIPTPEPNPTVPIPGAILLFAPGLAGLAALRRRMSR